MFWCENLLSKASLPERLLFDRNEKNLRKGAADKLFLIGAGVTSRSCDDGVVDRRTVGKNVEIIATCTHDWPRPCIEATGLSRGNSFPR